MELKVFNRELELLGIIDSFTSLRWIRRYYKSGEFELHCLLTTEALELLKPENIIYKGRREAVYINKRELTLNDEGEEVLKVQGHSLTKYIHRRINWGRLMMIGTVEEVMHRLVYNHCVNPSDSSRKIEQLKLGSLTGLGKKISYQNSYGNILDCLEALGTDSGYGYGIFINPEYQELLFEVYEGRNLSANQSTNPPCIFSRELENVYSQTYIDSRENYRNTCLIGGAGEDEERKLTSIEYGSGLDRYELFVDAREISNKEKVNEQEQEISWDRYEPLLLQKGSEKLACYQNIRTFDSKVNIGGNLVYQQDYDLGDIVTCYDPQWGITVDERITEIEEIYEGNRMSVSCTFGHNTPTLIDKIKTRMR